MAEFNAKQQLPGLLDWMRAQMKACGGKTAVIGISGGLDSTLALLVTVMTFDALKMPRGQIIGITMPGFGTTGRTYGNALNLMRTLGVDMREIRKAGAAGVSALALGIVVSFAVGAAIAAAAASGSRATMASASC